MSILNAFVLPEVALLGVDTEGVMPDGTICHACKLVALPHISAVVGVRGVDWMLIGASPVLLGFKGSFDALVKDIPELIEVTVKWCRETRGTPEDQLGVNMVLVGYSESAGRMIGHAFVRDAKTGELEVTHNFPQSIAPHWNDEDIATLKKSHGLVADKAGMITLAQHQSRWARERGPADFAAGGELYIAEVRRHSITIEKAFDFPPRQ